MGGLVVIVAIFAGVVFLGEMARRGRLVRERQPTSAIVMDVQHAAIREERAKKRRVILFALFALEVADVLTTNRFLAGGNASEGNPFMAAMQQSFGTFWWAPKLAIAMVAGLIVAQGRPRYLLTLVGMMALVVANNALLP
jgi:hypothetical protein